MEISTAISFAIWIGVFIGGIAGFFLGIITMKLFWNINKLKEKTEKESISKTSNSKHQNTMDILRKEAQNEGSNITAKNCKPLTFQR